MGAGARGFRGRVVAGAACLAAGLALPPLGLVLALHDGFDPPELESAVYGAWMLKLLLMADGLMLLTLPRLARESAERQPLWAPRPAAQPWAARHFTTALLVLLLAAFALRLNALNTDLWMDEVFTLVRTVRPPAGRLFAVFVDDNQHTLYSLCAKGSVALFGESAWALRLPAVVFGVAGIAATARLARLVFGPSEALLAAALLTFSYHHVWFSQNARAYTLLLCVASLSTELLLRALRGGRWRHWALYALVIFAGAFAHLTAVLLAAGQALVVMVLLLRKGRLASDWRRPAAGFAFAAWLTLHIYALVLPQIYAFFSQPGAGSAPRSLWTQPAWMIREVLGQVGRLGDFGWLGAILGIAVAALAFHWLARRDWVFLALTAAPAGLAIAVMLVLGRSLWPRSFFHLLGLAVAAVAALTIAFGYRLSKVSPKLRLAPAALLCVGAIATLPAVYRHPKQDYTGARDFVRSQLAPGDSVAALHMAGRVYSLYYAPEWRETHTIEELAAIQSPTGRTWVIYTLPRYLETRRPDLAALLRDRYERVRVFPGTLGDGDLFVLRSKSR